MREKASSVKVIATPAKKLQPQLDVNNAQDGWHVYFIDKDVEQLEKGQFLANCIRSLSFDETGPRFSALPKGVKSGLLAQSNTESERGLSVNAHIVTQE